MPAPKSVLVPVIFVVLFVLYVQPLLELAAGLWHYQHTGLWSETIDKVRTIATDDQLGLRDLFRLLTALAAAGGFATLWGTPAGRVRTTGLWLMFLAVLGAVALAYETVILVVQLGAKLDQEYGTKTGSTLTQFSRGCFRELLALLGSLTGIRLALKA